MENISQNPDGLAVRYGQILQEIHAARMEKRPVALEHVESLLQVLDAVSKASSTAYAVLRIINGEAQQVLALSPLAFGSYEASDNAVRSAQDHSAQAFFTHQEEVEFLVFYDQLGRDKFYKMLGIDPADKEAMAAYFKQFTNFTKTVVQQDPSTN